VAEELDGGPGEVVEIGGVPVPGVAGGVEAFAGADGVVAGQLVGGNGDGLIGGVCEEKPFGAGVDEGVVGGEFGLEEEGGALGPLAEGGVFTVVPDDGGEDVAAGAEVGAEIDGLVAPVVEVAAGGSGAETMAVAEEFVAAVAGDVDEEGGREAFELEGAAEVVDAEALGGGAGGRDPLGGPAVGEEVAGRLGGAGRTRLGGHAGVSISQGEEGKIFFTNK